MGPVETRRALEGLGVAWTVGLLAVLIGPSIARAAELRAAQPAGSVVWAYPSPGTKTASPTTQISLRGDLRGGLASLRVVGTRSGRHAGRVVAHSDGRGASFLPARRFIAGERVTVTGIAVAGARRRPYSFRIARFVANSPLNRRMGRIPAANTMKLVTRPDLEPPAWDVRVADPGATPSEIFAGPKLSATGNGQNGVQILSATGKVLFWTPMPGAQLATDVRVQAYRGQAVMTYWHGVLGLGQGRGEGVIVDTSYRVVKRVQMGNGYGMDLHDFRLTPEGTALVMAYQAVRYDMRSVGGPRTGRVVDAVIQEIDLATGLVLFEWHSLGNVGLDESDWRRRPRVPWDYFHANSVYPDGPDGLIVSARHTNAVYRIGRATGMIDWRLGGKESDFRLGRGASFARQHDAEVQADGSLRIFDNSNRLGRRRTRVITLRLDRRAKRATLVRAAERPDRLFAGTQGNAALLPNGNLFVDWGSRGVISEIDPSNRLVFDAQLGAGWSSYRAYRANWSGAPLSRPKLAVRVSRTGASRLYASWNGATEVASWRVFAGPRGDALSPVGSTPWRDLESSMRVMSTGPFFAVQALDAAGRVLGTSPTVRRRP